MKNPSFLLPAFFIPGPNHIYIRAYINFYLSFANRCFIVIVGIHLPPLIPSIMFGLTKTLIITGIITISSSCASVVSRSGYFVTVDSSPSDAIVTINDRYGHLVFKGETPAHVKLRSGAGFFTGAVYEVIISKKGFATKTVELRSSLNGWYFGNVLLSSFGLIGMLIVDPITGAMFRLNKTAVNETLEPELKTAVAQGPQLRIYDVNEIPASWKDKLVAIDQ
jgi:hypothetical protein